MVKHTADALCPSCEQKLLTADPRLGVFFRLAKLKYPNLHVDWAYRDQADQAAAVAAGKSLLNFPNSAHNKTPSMAIDLFQEDSSGLAIFDGVCMAKINAEFGQGFRWGGEWKSLGDSLHFEIAPTT